MAEDNKTFQDIVSGFLEFLGFEVAPAGNGIEALAIFIESIFDSVLTDLQMPAMDGLKLASHIKKRSPSTPLILLTGSERKTVLKKVERGPVDAVIFKRFRGEDLQRTVQEVLASRDGEPGIVAVELRLCYHSCLLFFQREEIMKRFILQMSLILALAFAGILATSQALAERPSGAAVKKAEKHKQEEMGEKHKGKESRDQGASYDRSGHAGKGSEYFSEQNQRFIHEYYAEQFRKGRCPPGLAKKGNGCMPPGQAKKWRKGRPLPKDVIFYDLPPSVLGQLGPAPSRHRFVRVDQDILLITAGKGMVVDAIEDIGRKFN